MPHKSSQAPMVSGSGRYVESGAVAGAHRPQPSDLTSKKISPDGFSTCKQYDAPLSKLLSNLAPEVHTDPDPATVTCLHGKGRRFFGAHNERPVRLNRRILCKGSRGNRSQVNQGGNQYDLN